MNKKNKIIIITSKDDTHADHIISMHNGLYKKESQIIRINTEDFALNSRVLFSSDGFDITILDSDKNFKSQEVRSVWFRRPQAIKQSDELSAFASEFTQKQWVAFIRGFYFSTHDSAKWYNPLPAIHRARIKLQQLTLAKELNIQTPAVCVTNCPKQARDFSLSYGEVCTKSLDEPSHTVDGHIFPMYTRKVDKESEFDDVKSISVAPIYLQEFIDKTSDIRVIVIDKKIFAVEIYSQDREESKVDFRAVSPYLLRHSEIKLPDMLQEKIVEFMLRQKLRFSALDFVRDKKSGALIFLENNCNGQWLWLERECGAPISNALLSALSN